MTAGVDRMTFLQPVHVGDLLTLQASVNAAWRTSMEVGVRVEAENPRTGEIAPHQQRLPDDGRARRRRAARARCRRCVPETADEQRREREAQVRRANRLAERDQLRQERTSEDPLTAR